MKVLSLILVMVLFSCSRDRTVVRGNRGVRSISTHQLVKEKLHDCSHLMVEANNSYKECVELVRQEHPEEMK